MNHIPINNHYLGVDNNLVWFCYLQIFHKFMYLLWLFPRQNAVEMNQCVFKWPTYTA